MKRLHRIVTLIVAPLLLGGLMYVFWGPERLLLLRGLRSVGGGPLLEKIRAVTFPNRSLIPAWILSYLADGLWMFALTAGLMEIWNHRLTFRSGTWLVLALLTAIGYEYAQGTQFYGQGTPDVMDGAVYLLGWILALLTSHPWRNGKTL